MRAAPDGRLDVQPRRRPAHPPHQIRADLLDDGPLGASDDVAVDRLERAHDLLHLERAIQRRGIDEAARGDEVLDERHRPVADRQVGGGLLSGGAGGRQEQEQERGAHGEPNLTRKCERGTRNTKTSRARGEARHYIPAFQSSLFRVQTSAFRVRSEGCGLKATAARFSNPATASMLPSWIALGASSLKPAIPSTAPSGAPPPSRSRRCRWSKTAPPSVSG